MDSKSLLLLICTIGSIQMSVENKMNFRRATHAGTWYSDDRDELSVQIENWLKEANVSHGPARVIIVPHAGYYYSGACAAHAYKQIIPKTINRIFIFGPSHKIHLKKCALSSAHIYETPFYDIEIDHKMNTNLLKIGDFAVMEMRVDEDEHSIEMQLPYIAKLMDKYREQYKIVPVLVGSLSSEQAAAYGKIFSEYLKQNENLFIVSSDFCHWGTKFDYTYYDKSMGPIYKSIQNVDKIGMEIIETLDPDRFQKYLTSYNNTICGRYPILMILESIRRLLHDNPNYNGNMKFLKYVQSSACMNMNDSSVSYAAASLIFESK